MYYYIYSYLILFLAAASYCQADLVAKFVIMAVAVAATEPGQNVFALQKNQKKPVKRQTDVGNARLTNTFYKT